MLASSTMTRWTSALFMALAFTAASAWAEEGATEQESRLIALVLKQNRPESGYLVVSPETSFGHRLAHVNPEDPKSAEKLEEYKKELAQRLAKKGVPAALVLRLLERNRESVRLSLASAPKEGYVLDDGTYRKYFEKEDGGGWRQWYKEHPEARGHTRVSLPAYDEKAGLVLVYIGTQRDYLDGEGWVILYRYENGALKEVAREMLWIS